VAGRVVSLSSEGEESGAALRVRVRLEASDGATWPDDAQVAVRIPTGKRARASQWLRRGAP
jgi:hypothetical protein